MARKPLGWGATHTKSPGVSRAPTPIFAPKLTRGDQVRVIAPSRSRALVLEHDHRSIINGRVAQLGLSLSYGSHVDERDAFESACIASRVADLHEAFADLWFLDQDHRAHTRTIRSATCRASPGT